MTSYPIRQRRRRATVLFYWKVALLSLVMAGIAWSAWLSPWARTHHPTTIEISH